MGIVSRLNRELATLKAAGYSQVSASELAWRTGLPIKSVIGGLYGAGIQTATHDDEVYALLVEQTATFSDLPKPKSAILDEVS